MAQARPRLVKTRFRILHVCAFSSKICLVSSLFFFDEEDVWPRRAPRHRSAARFRNALGRLLQGSVEASSDSHFFLLFFLCAPLFSMPQVGHPQGHHHGDPPLQTQGQVPLCRVAPSRAGGGVPFYLGLPSWTAHFRPNFTFREINCEIFFLFAHFLLKDVFPYQKKILRL